MAKIMIAEDSPTAVEMFKRYLAPLGHDIVVASNGQDAETLVRSEQPDLLILDIIMPKVNGFQLCRALRSDPTFIEMPILMITSMDRESDRYWGMKQGATDYLVKPVDAKVLVEKVLAFLPGAND